MKIKKIMIVSVLILAAGICLVLAGLSVVSYMKHESGMVNGHLRPCPDTPNCVCSECADDAHYVEPISYEGSSASALKRITLAIMIINGRRLLMSRTLKMSGWF